MSYLESNLNNSEHVGLLAAFRVMAEKHVSISSPINKEDIHDHHLQDTDHFRLMDCEQMKSRYQHQRGMMSFKRKKVNVLNRTHARMIR